MLVKSLCSRVTSARSLKSALATLPPRTRMNATSGDCEIHARLQEASTAFQLSPLEEHRFERATGGVNNLTAFLLSQRNLLSQSNGSKLYVIRIYIHTTAAALQRVMWEWEVLMALSKVMDENAKRGAQAKFQIPKPVPHPATGKTYAILSDGSIASAFHVIPGFLCSSDPTLSYKLGQAAGELSVLMGQVKKMDIQCPLPPVHDIPLMSKESFIKAIHRQELDGVREAIDYLLQAMVELEIEVQRLIDADLLPRQLIHADLHHENALSNDGEISGILDFEFAAYDWRAQDLAICLSKYVSEQDPMIHLARFCEGWRAVCPLTADEADALPILIRLRILSNVVFFIGRWVANEAAIETLIDGRAQAYVKRLEWIKQHEVEIKRLMIQ